MGNISNDSIDNDNANLKHGEHRNEEEQTELMPKKKQIRMEPKPEIGKHKESVESLPFGMKLKKTETVKSKVAETKLVLPKLKHHEFENVPEDTSNEEMTKIKLTKLIVVKEEKGKNRKEKRKV